LLNLSLACFSQTTIEKINELLVNDKLDQAENEILKFFPNDTVSKDYLLLMSRLSRRRGNYLTASKYLIRCMPLDSAQACSGMAILHSIKGENQIALQYITRAMRIDPSQREFFTTRGNIYYSMSEYKKAIPDYLEAIKLDASDDHAYYNLGLVYFSLSDYKKAEESISRSIQLRPNMSSYYQRGLTYYYSDQYEKAISDFNTSLQYIGNLNFYEEMPKGQVYHFISLCFYSKGKKLKSARFERKARKNGWTGKLEGVLN
jgi:tetratricopeptide (TPR) repeat protein